MSPPDDFPPMPDMPEFEPDDKYLAFPVNLLNPQPTWLSADSNYVAMRNEAQGNANKLAEQSAKHQHPKAALLANYTKVAFEAAVRLVILSRSTEPDEVTMRPVLDRLQCSLSGLAFEFCVSLTLLDELATRIEQIPDVTKMATNWLRTPGATFERGAADSALLVALEFAGRVFKLTLAGRGKLGTVDWPLSNPPQGLEEAYCRTITILRENTVPTRDWPTWKMKADAGALMSKIKDETTRLSAGTPAQAGGKRAGAVTWRQAQQKAEAHVSANGFPGVRSLARIVRCHPTTMSKAILKSQALNARKAEYLSMRLKAKEICLSSKDLDNTIQTTESAPDQLATLIAEQETDAKNERRAPARARSRR